MKFQPGMSLDHHYFRYTQFCEKTQSGGFTEEQAEVFASEQARLIENKLATKNDLVELETNLRRDMLEMEYRIIIKLGGLLAASIAVVAMLVSCFK
ncbi:MAG: DUF1640 domain-containing protein [Methylobacter sp.]|nr:DUF1640 domain-containing protein [Methylobacter sp.]